MYLGSPWGPQRTLSLCCPHPCQGAPSPREPIRAGVGRNAAGSCHRLHLTGSGTFQFHHVVLKACSPHHVPGRRAGTPTFLPQCTNPGSKLAKATAQPASGGAGPPTPWSGTFPLQHSVPLPQLLPSSQDSVGQRDTTPNGSGAVFVSILGRVVSLNTSGPRTHRCPEKTVKPHSSPDAAQLPSGSRSWAGNRPLGELLSA